MSRLGDVVGISPRSWSQSEMEVGGRGAEGLPAPRRSSREASGDQTAGSSPKPAAVWAAFQMQRGTTGNV